VARSLAITYYRTSGSSYNCSASIDYFDADNDPQETPFYYWEIADDASGNNAKNIGFAGSDFIIAETQFNKWVRFTVTPRAKTGLLAGTPKTSSWTQLINNAPVAMNPSITINDNSYFFASYDFVDTENDPSDTPIYKWEISDELGNITSQTGVTPYYYFSTIPDKWVRVTITPKASAGVLMGTSETSRWINTNNTAPQAVPEISFEQITDGLYSFKGTYSYIDDETDEEDKNSVVYSWEKSPITYAGGMNGGEIIPGVSTSTMTLNISNTYIRLNVYIAAKTGKKNWGSCPFQSAWVWIP
ncbi:MAG: hypothetical protein K0M50_05835, partial [Prolixibacteraceae bacterium]|nr:hypothetical protein [Prolixibacteraceae bacterium]